MKFKLRISLVAVLLLAGVVSLRGQQPFISDFNPKLGGSGDKITLTGSGFYYYGPITVKFWNGKMASVDTLTTDTSATVTVPPGTTTGPISIERTGSGVVQYTASDFMVVGSGPFITGFTPTYGVTNDYMTITGVHFGGVAANGVNFGGKLSADASTISDGTKIFVHVPSGAVSGPITVTCSSGVTSSTNTFIVAGPKPYIADFTPCVGTPGTKVTIHGKLLVYNQVQPSLPNVTNISFNGRSASISNNASDTQIEVIVPAGATSGPLSALGPNGVWTSSSNFFLPPVMGTISPSVGRTGTNVTITGANFVGASRVRFNGVDADYVVVNNSTIQATVPDGASSGIIMVSAPAGSAPGGSFTIPPTIYGFSPVGGGAGTSVTLTGANFNDGGLVVRFNGTQATSVSGVSFGQLTAQVPAGATTGPISVSTTNGSFTTVSNFFLPASISGFSPSFGAAGTTVTVTGQNFIGATLVTFNGVGTTSFTVTNNTTIGVRVPAGFTTGPISVTTPAGLAVSSTKFYGLPVITGFTPTHGLPGDTVTITGTNFTDASAVRFNGTSTPFTLTDNFTLQTKVPDGAQTGPVTVVTPGGSSVSASSFVLDYSSDLSVTAVASPDPVTQTSNVVYTITVWNKGPQDAPNVRLTNTLASSVQLRDSYTTRGSLVTNGAPVNPIIGNLGTIPAYNSAIIRLTVTPRVAGNLQNVTTVSSDYNDPQLSDNTFILRSYVQPLPILSIQLISASQYTVSWPYGLFGFSLEYKSALAGGAGWVTATNIPSLINGQYVITEGVSEISRFYRLRK